MRRIYVHGKLMKFTTMKDYYWQGFADGLVIGFLVVTIGIAFMM